jgi:hypothetical protein
MHKIQRKVVSCVCETLSVALKEKHRLNVLKKTVLLGIFGSRKEKAAGD